MSAMAFAILTEDLTRVFRERRRGQKTPREVVALDSVSLEVRHGELFGLLGPNGAGKTTLIKILTTLLLPTRGRAFVDGVNVVTHPEEVRGRINLVSGGDDVGYGILTTEETLWMFSQFYGVPGRVARAQIDFLVNLLGLSEVRKIRLNKLSTGMKQRMAIARGFINDPKIVFLDEPTLGLDVPSAVTARRFFRHWLNERPNRTVFLTTHTMSEAEQLCDRIAILSRGRIVACDTPNALKKMVQRETIYEMEASYDGSTPPHLGPLSGVVLSSVVPVEPGTARYRLVLASDAALPAVLTGFQGCGLALRALQKKEPSLEDVFLRLTGHSFEEEHAQVAQTPAGT
ncbi:MAG: ATP-binding cassette domain-containing protein [bacterium JZ-2024 1]